MGGGGTMVVSSSSSNTNGGTLSRIRSQALQSVVHTDIDSGLPWCSPIHKYGKCPGKNQCCATDFNDHGFIVEMLGPVQETKVRTVMLTINRIDGRFGFVRMVAINRT